MSSSVPPTLGRRVADCRERLGWTQKTLAEKAGLSITFLSEVENDRRAPGTQALLDLADALGASLDYLVKGIAESGSAKRALVIPPELTEAAEQGGWSVGAASDLLKFRQMVVARRSRSGEVDQTDRELKRRDWEELYQAYVRAFGADNDGSTRT